MPPPLNRWRIEKVLRIISVRFGSCPLLNVILQHRLSDTFFESGNAQHNVYPAIRFFAS